MTTPFLHYFCITSFTSQPDLIAASIRNAIPSCRTGLKKEHLSMIYDIQLSSVKRPDADFIRKIGAERDPVRVEFNIASKHGFDISKISVLVSIGDIDDSEIISVARHALHDLCTRLSEQTLPWKQDQSYFDGIRSHAAHQPNISNLGKALQ